MSKIERQQPDKTGLPQRLYTRAELTALTGYRRTKIDGLIAQKKFPPGTLIGPRRRVWTGSEIAAWQRKALAGE